MTAPRATFGAADARGIRTVYVDGTAAGSVARGRRDWLATDLDKATTSHRTRAIAAAHLVAYTDARAARLARTAAQVRAREVAPDGWRFAPWRELGPGDLVRAPSAFGTLDDDSGRCYPRRFTADLRLSKVDMLDNGAVVLTGSIKGLAHPYVLLLIPAWVEIGALVPAGGS